jgi:hypothetical protein
MPEIRCAKTINAAGPKNPADFLEVLLWVSDVFQHIIRRTGRKTSILEREPPAIVHSRLGQILIPQHFL